MTWYLEGIAVKCQWDRAGCPKQATHALHTSGTARYGYYCKKHGDMEAAKRNAEDAQKASKDKQEGE